MDALTSTPQTLPASEAAAARAGLSESEAAARLAAAGGSARKPASSRSYRSNRPRQHADRVQPDPGRVRRRDARVRDWRDALFLGVIVADGELVGARELRVDESVLTGEPDAVARSQGEQVRSGAFVVEGSGEYVGASGR